MKNSLFSLVVLACFFILLLFGCENNKIPVSPEQEVNDVETEAAISVLLDYGFSREDIEVGDDFLIAEGDICFSKQSLLEKANQFKKTAQKRRDTILNRSAVSNIKVRIHPSLQDYPFAWRNAIEIGMNNWKSANGSVLHFSLVSSGEDILICSDQVEGLPPEYSNFSQYYDQNGNYEAGIYARSTYPPDVNTPGSLISIDDDAPVLSHFYNKTEVVLHELGHAFGLLHTYDSGTLISGTPLYDNSSVMNYVVDYRNTLSEGDKEAVRVLYPAYHLQVGPNPGNNRIKLTWDAITEPGLVYYEVWRNVGNWRWFNIATTTNNYFIDPNYCYGPPNTINYKIKAKDTDDNYSIFSDEVLCYGYYF